MLLEELDELLDPEDDEDALDDEAAGFESDPDDADDVPAAFEDDVAGVLLDEEPRLSFR